MANKAATLEIEAELANASRTHRALSADGTEIAGNVYGQGPPVVLVHAGLGHGELDWGFALPFLKERFTCYCMSTRGRGLSADHPDQSIERQVEDVVAFVESIGEPVGLAGPSGGAMFVLGAAARSKAIAAAAACDPLALEVLGEDDVARFEEAVGRMGELAQQGRLVEAARDWMTEWANEREMAALAESGYLEACSTYVPALLHALEGAGDSDDYSPTASSVLARITVPVLILQGAEADATWPWFTASVRHIADHVAHPHVRKVAGAGHMGAWVEPEAYAGELIGFFSEVLETV